jgi:gliding-associated putative ABC transporter substrate-binding component GldG
MNGKKTTDQVSNVAYVAVILAIVIVVNVLGSNFFGRLDLTENKLYSISPTTKEILGDLDDVVSVRAYFSKKLPVQLSRLPKEVDDMLEEYMIYSGGNIHYERIDPGDDEELKRQLAQTGIMPVTMTIIEKDERQQINGYLAMTVSYGEKTEPIPMVENTSDLEYELTSRVYRVTTEPQYVGFLSSHTRHDLMGDYGAFAQEVRKIHEIEPVDLSSEVEIPERINALIVAGPTDSVPEQVKFAVDQFIMRGGRALFLVDNLVVEQRMPRMVDHGLKFMLMKYGLNMAGDVVRDQKSHSPQRVSQGIFTFNQPNPFFPHVIKEQFGDHPVVARLSELTLPWTGTVEPSAQPDSNLVYSVLATTSDVGQSLGPPTFQPSGTQARLPLIVLASGKFKSAFEGRTDLVQEGGSLLNSSSVETDIMLVGSSSFIENQYFYPGNLEFMLNAIDFLTIGDKLISIRTRPTTDRPLKSISAEMKNFLRIISIVGVPIFVIIFGSMRFYLKRRDKAVHSRSL